MTTTLEQKGEVLQRIQDISDVAAVNIFFDLLAEMIRRFGLSEDDPRLALNVRNESSRRRISVNINGRLVFGLLKTGQNLQLLFAVFEEGYNRISQQITGLSIWGDKFKDEQPQALMCALSVTDFIAQDTEPLLEEWNWHTQDYLPKQAASQYRKHHIPLLYEMAEDVTTRNSVLMEAASFVPKTGSREYYCVGFTWDGVSQLERFIKAGIWENGYDDKFSDIVNKVATNALIAAKTSYTRKESGATISVLEVHAIGSVTRNSSNGSSLEVAWHVLKPTLKIDGKGAYRSTINRVWNEEAIKAIFNQEMRKDLIDAENLDDEQPALTHPLNAIFYGPPGTGKTYHSINHALAIIENKKLETIDNESKQDREAIKLRFDKLLIKDWDSPQGQIGFITFHQSLSYEDFIEGIKPLKPEEGSPLQYGIVNGILKRLCIEAAFSCIEQKTRVGYMNRFLEFSELYDAFTNSVNERIEKGEEVLLQTRTGQNLRIVEISDNNNIRLKHGDGEKTYIVSKSRLARVAEAYPNVSVMQNIDREVRNTIGGANGSAYWAILNYIQTHSNAIEITEVALPTTDVQYSEEEKQLAITGIDWTKLDLTTIKPYILIIDEINRGNVSQIFGELITLIEDGKRAGQPEALSATLPYSRESFSVPPNLYIIGTMNTADRSVEALDTALRRRFTFEEKAPQPDLLSEDVEGINLRLLLSTINERLEVLIDRDHTIGHAWLMGSNTAQEVAQKFRTTILPLLREYFYNDYSKIGLVLGDAFVKQKNSKSTAKPFATFAAINSGIRKELAELPLFEVSVPADNDTAALVAAFRSVYQQSQPDNSNGNERL